MLPLVCLPPEGGFWCDPPISDNTPLHTDSDSDIAGVEQDYPSNRSYRAHFLQSEHFNFCGRDPNLGPVVLSLKYYNQEDSNSYHIRAILRLPTGTIHRLLTWDKRDGESSPIEIARILCQQVSLHSLTPVLGPGTAQLLLDYDE